MNTPDLINASFEGISGLVQWTNVYRLYKDQQAKGINAWAFVFFGLWGGWNIYYYWDLHQYLSQIASFSITTSNLA